jgi:hypothetical protein
MLQNTWKDVGYVLDICRANQESPHWNLLLLGCSRKETCKIFPCNGANHTNMFKNTHFYFLDTYLPDTL